MTDTDLDKRREREKERERERGGGGSSDQLPLPFGWLLHIADLRHSEGPGPGVRGGRGGGGRRLRRYAIERKRVLWSFTPSQPLQLPRGGRGGGGEGMTGECPWNVEFVFLIFEVCHSTSQWSFANYMLVI